MGAVDTTYTFTATDTITSTKMNNIIDQTTMTSDAVITSSPLSVSGGKLTVKAGGITSNELATNAVVTNSITDLNVTTGKLADSSVIAAKLASDSVTTVKILNANITPAKLSQPLTLETAKSATGTSIEFTGIPSWVKRITMMFNGVSTSGTSALQIQLGDSGGYEVTGYSGVTSSFSGSSIGTAALSSGINLSNGADTAATTRDGVIYLNKLSGNIWVFSGGIGSSTTRGAMVFGKKELSDVLDRVQVTTVNGTDTFDAGSINIMYE